MSRTLAIVLVLLGACSSPSGRSAQAPNDADPPSSDPTQASSTPVTGSLTVTDAEGTTGPFRIGAVDALMLEGSCASAPPGKHTLRFDVLSPSGTVYASMPQEVVIPASGVASVQSALPLRGTTVESLRRAGTWNVTLTLDGGEPLASADLDLTR